MRIAIIDDEKPARSELMYLILEVCSDAYITEISSGEEALNILSIESYDIICIDINLGDISGITLAITLRKMHPNSQIVFATAYNNYAEKAFEVDALFYLLKPFSKHKVEQMLGKYKKKQMKLDDKQKINVSKLPICVDKKFIMIDVNKIAYIEAQNRVCVIHTRVGNYQDNNTLNYFEERLIDKGFLRIHKSFLVHLNDVLEVYPWFNNSYCVKMDGFKDEIIPVSRNKIKELKKLLNI